MEDSAMGLVQLAAGKVSIIILNYNGRRNLAGVLKECLDSVMHTDYPDFEVLFVDNGSTDDSVNFMCREYGKDPRINIVKNERNFGYAEGNNVGLRKADGAYFALLNNDTKVDPRWLQVLVDAVESPKVGAAQSKIVRMDEPRILDCAGGLLDFYGYHFERGRGESVYNYDNPGEIFYAKGASFLLKREVLAEVGLFDSDIFLYFDEVDLCWRIWLSGHMVVYAPTSIVSHFSGKTASALQQRQRMFFYVRNHFLVLLKNYSLANVFYATIVSLLFEARNFTLFLLRGKPLLALSIIRGIFWNLTHLNATLRKRQVVQNQIRQVSDGDIKRHMLKPFPPFPLYILFSRARYRRADPT